MNNAFEKNEKKSIRNIPIPNRVEKELIDQKITAAEQNLIESVVTKTEHVKDIHVPMRQIRVTSHNVDGIRRLGRKKKIKEDDETVPVQKSIDKSNIKHVEYTVEPAFVDKDTIEDSLDSGDSLAVSDEAYESWSKYEKKGYVFWIICGAIVAILLFAISYLFSGATITIVPKKYDMSIESTKVYLSDVDHRKVSVTASSEITVTVSGTVRVDRKATGIVVLYNAFSTSEQKLVAGTRLETTGGKIFKIKDTVTIPGQKTVSGKKVPGSIQASVEAGDTGESYNVGYQDFKLPAYKGTSRYELIYARSKDSIQGGYSGEVPNVSSANIASSTKELKEQLLTEVLQKIQKDTSSEYVFIRDSYVVDYGKIQQDVSKDGTKVTFKGTVTMTAILLNINKLSKTILGAKNILDANMSTLQYVQYSGDVSSLKVELPKDTIAEDLANTTKMYMLVSGTTSIYSLINEDTVTRAVSNLTKDRAVLVLQELADSNSVTISIWPWWSSVLPGKDKIRLKIK